MITTNQEREPVFTSTAIFPEDTWDPHIPYRKNRNSFFKRGFKNQYRGVWGCLWIGSCVLWTEYWESYSCSPWLVVTESYSIVAVFQRVARHPLVEILTTLNSSGYDNGVITKVNLKKKIVPHYNLFILPIMPLIHPSFLEQLIVSNFCRVLQSSKQKLNTAINHFFSGGGGKLQTRCVIDIGRV